MHSTREFGSLSDGRGASSMLAYTLHRMRCSITVLRPVQRSLYLLALWTCFCYVIFQITSKPEASPYSEATVNSRLLLQKVTDIPPPTPSTPALDQLLAKLTPVTEASRSVKEEDLASQIQAKLPNVPFEYWVKKRNQIYTKNHTCAHYPSVYDLKFNNVYWQMLKSSNGTFYLYGAYYDNRKLNSLGPTVRILGMMDRIEPTVKTFCQLWFDASKDPVITPVLEYKHIWNKKWGNYRQGLLQPYLMACQIPQPYRNAVPLSVSVTEKGCEPPTNNVRVVNERPEKKSGFAVCVKGLDFLHEDLSVRLVEWIELLLSLGADKIFLYELEVHPNISKVLEYYKQTGRVLVTPITLPGEQPNVPGFRHLYLKSKITSKRQNELIPYNDCLYRNLYSYNYIALMDTDEVIMPLVANNWHQLMDGVLEKAFKIGNYTRASYNFRNVYFWDDKSHSHNWDENIPQYMHMLQHVHRSGNYTKPNQYVKCFHNVERVLTLHNHFPISCLNTGCTSFPVDPVDGHLQHYRADCVSSLKKDCDEFKQNLIRDDNIWRFKEKLIPRVTDVLAQLGFFGASNNSLLTGPTR